MSGWSRSWRSRRRADLEDTDLREAGLEETDLREADLEGANLEGVAGEVVE